MKQLALPILFSILNLSLNAQVSNILKDTHVSTAKKCKDAVDGQWCIIKGDGIVVYSLDTKGYRSCMNDWKSMKEKMDKLYGYGRQVKFEIEIPAEMVQYNEDPAIMSAGILDGSIRYKFYYEYTTNWGVVMLMMNMDKDGYSILIAAPKNR